MTDYFALNSEEDTKENLLIAIRANLELYERAGCGHSYLLEDFVQNDLNRLIAIAKKEEQGGDIENRKIRITRI